jgi:excisionase family DNA binding protein
MTKLLSVPEVATQLGRSEDFVRRLAQRRLIGHVKGGPHGRLQFTQADVDRYIAARRVEPLTTLDLLRQRRGRAS